MADVPAINITWDKDTDFYEMERVRTGISLTPRILSAMLVGGNAMGVNWAAKFAHIPEMDVPENALKPVLRGKMFDLGGELMLSQLLPPDVLGDLTETMSLDDVRDGIWIKDVLEVVTARLARNASEEVEHIYQYCQMLMEGADTTVFYWDAHYVMHMLGMEHIDDASFHMAAKFYNRFADEDPVGSLFALFMLSFLGPTHFNIVVRAVTA